MEFLPSKSDPSALPILLGLTGATEPDNLGVIEDVIGTAGVRVRLESGSIDVYYIGAEPLLPGHPYHAQAVAAHRALVAGRKVSLRNDAVTRNARGQRIAYVFLGDEEAVPNLVNARLIADGLAKAGNFEGNTRYSVYLQNLELITRQNRKGLWAFE